MAQRKTLRLTENAWNELLEKQTQSTENPLAPKTKRQGAAAQPILSSIKNAKPFYHLETKDNNIIKFELLWFGARFFTLNELLALKEFRPYVTFNYKSIIQNKIQESLKLISIAHPQLILIDRPLHFTFYRQGKKNIDRDSFQVMFKYLIDALKYDKQKNPHGLLKDDNPDILFSDEIIQSTDPKQCAIGLKFHIIDPIPKTQKLSPEDFFNHDSFYEFLKNNS